MKSYLFFAVFIGSFTRAQQGELIWSAVQQDKDIEYKSTFYSDADYLYILEDGSRKEYIHKVDIKTLTISETVETSLKWNKSTHKILRGFTFADQPHVLSKTFNESKGITTTWIHSFNMEKLQFSEPVKIADYNTPRIKNGYIDPNEEATRIFSNNLIGIYTSPGGEHCVAISSKDMVGNVTENNKKKEQEKTFIIHHFSESLTNLKTFELIPPSNTFYIYQAAVDLDGSFYIMGRTLEIDYAKMRSMNNQNIYALNDLTIIKFNTDNGNYINEKIETDDIYLRDVRMYVDNGVQLSGLCTSPNNKSHLIFSQYDSDLILRSNLDEEIGTDLSNQVNFNFEIEIEKKRYKKEFDQEPANIPLLNFETILFEKLDNGHLIFGIEKQTAIYSATASASSMAVRSDLILFCIYQGSLKWYKVINKDQAYTDYESFGITTINDGKQLHLIYNEGDFKLEHNKTYIPLDLIGNSTKPQRLKHLVIDDNGNIETKTDTNLANVNSLFNYSVWSREYIPGHFLILAKNKSGFSIGTIHY